MTKNKKKLRRAERRYSVSRTAQTLVLTGLLLAGGVGSVFAATEINTAANWDASAATGDITYTGTTGKEAAVSTSAANIAGTLGTLTITGADTAATLTAAHDLAFTGAVSITGVSGKLGSLSIDTGKTFTSATKTTVGDFGKIVIAGTHAGLLEATGATGGVIELAGTQEGNVLLDGTGASLTSTDNAAKVQGDVTVNKGTISTASGNLTIVGTLELKDANAVFTPTASKTLEVGTLKLGTNVAVGAGTLSITSGLETTETTSLTLNTGGIIHYKGVDARLDTWTSGLLLGTGGTLIVDKTLVMDGFNIKATKGAAGSSTTITAAALELDRKGTIGAADRGTHTMTINATADTAFLSGGDLTLVGATSNVTTLNLNGISSSDSNIILSGQTDGGAILNVGKNAQGSPTTISMGTLTVGTVAPGPHGTVLIQGANAKLSILSVTGLNLSTDGKVNLGAFGVLNINNNFEIADNKIGATSAAGGIQVVADSALHVRGTLTLTPNAGVGNGVSAGVAPIGGGATNPGTVVADVVKAGASGTEKLTWTGGSLTLLGDGAGKFLEASELEITGNGVNLGMVNDAPAIQGGTFANKVTMTGGKLHVNKGEWTLSNTVDGLKVDATSSVDVIGGTLNVAKWTSTVTANSVAANVTGGTLNLTGDVATNAGNIKASAGGVVTALGSKVIHSDFTKTVGGVGTFEVLDTGVLKISSAAKSMTLGAYGTLKTALMGAGTGTLRLEDVTVTDIDSTTNVKDLAGLSVHDKVLAVTTDTVNSYGNEVMGLKGAGAADVTLTVSGGLTIVGGNSAGFALSDNGTNNTHVIVSAANSQLNLGSNAGPRTAGTLLGNVTLSDNAANLNATNGTFTVGDVIASTNGNGVVTANGASLTAGKLGTSSNLIGAVTAQNGIVTTVADAFVTTVNLENGGLQAKDMTVTTANVSKGGTLLATNDMTLTTANVTEGQISAGNKLTVTNAMDATKVTIRAKELDAAAAITAANSDINVGNMVLKAAVNLTEGTTMNVDDFTGHTGATTVTVGATADKTGSSLIIGKLTSGVGKTTFFVDPIADNSLVQVQSVAAVGTSDLFIAANNGIVSFGEHGMDWAKTQMAESGMAPTAALILSSPVKLAATGQLLVGKDFDNTGQWNATGSATTHALDVRGNSLIIADVTNLGSNAALTLDATKATARIDSTAGLRLYSDSLKGGQSYTLVSGLANAAGSGLVQNGTAMADGASLSLASKSTSNMLVGLGDVVYNQGTGTNGTLKASTYATSASDVLPKISTSMGSYLENMARTTGFDTASGNTGIRFVSRALDNRFIGTNDPTLAAATIEGAAQLAVVGAAPAMTISAAQVATSAANTRTSFATPLMDTTKAVALHQGTDGNLSLDSGLSAGSSMKTGLGVWIMPLYQSNSVWGMKAENFKGGYSSDLGGVALGADYTIDDSLRFGLAFNLGGGYAQSNGDFSSTDNSFNFWGINLYGGWTQNNFGISGDVGYTSTYNKLKQETPAALQMGDIKSDVTSRAWTAGLRGEYKFATEALDIIPHVGVRYLGLTTDSYKAKIGGETVFKADEAYQSIWTFPVGVTFAKEITNASGWTFRPQVDLGITPATGDVKAKSRVRIPNVDGSAEMKMQVMDYMSYDGGVGLEMKKDNVSFGINYNIQASEHRTGHGVFGTLRYEF